MLISIQSLILCAEPYYNEPGFERLYGTPQGDSESLKYSEEVFRNNLKYAVVGQLTNPPEGFEDVVRAHFYLKRDFLLEVKIDTNCVFEKFAWLNFFFDWLKVLQCSRKTSKLAGESGKLYKRPRL